MRAAVTIDAGGSLAIAALHRLAVKAAIIGRLLVGVAGGAGDFQRRRFVSRTLYVSVTIHAGKHAAVNGIFKALRINVQADRLAVDIVRESGIAMAR
jgi:hypothetical protein